MSGHSWQREALLHIASVYQKAAARHYAEANSKRFRPNGWKRRRYLQLAEDQYRHARMLMGIE